MEDALFCVAGGIGDEVGFFADITPSQIRSCMENNYFSAAFIAHAILKLWLAKSILERQPTKRHIIFTASTAALTCLSIRLALIAPSIIQPIKQLLHTLEEADLRTSFKTLFLTISFL